MSKRNEKAGVNRLVQMTTRLQRDAAEARDTGDAERANDLEIVALDALAEIERGLSALEKRAGAVAA